MSATLPQQLRLALHRYDADTVLALLVSARPGEERHGGTLRNQRASFRKFVLAARQASVDLRRPPPAFVEAFVVSLADLSPGHVRNLLSRLRGIYTALGELGVVGRQVQPFRPLGGPPLAGRPGERRAYFSGLELEVLHHHAGTEDRCLLLLGAQAGLGTGEMTRLTWQAVQLTEAAVQVGGRQIPKSAVLDDALRAWARKNGGVLASGPVFEYRDGYALRRRLFGLCQSAGVPYRPWQALRASAALALWRSTHDPQLMTERLGLTSLKAVEAYQRMDQGSGGRP